MVRLCKICKHIKTIERKRFQKTKKQEATKRRKRYKEDIQFRLGILLRSRISHLLTSGSAVRDLGCSLGGFKSYLEAKWQPGMNWDNYSLHGWHIDHIIPLSSFDLTNSKEFEKACHYTNLQPLWSYDNLSKGNRTLETH